MGNAKEIAVGKTPETLMARRAIARDENGGESGSTLEDELRQAAEALIVKGKEHGYLTPDDILQSFPQTEAEPGQVCRIFAAFNEIGIEVAHGERDFEEVEAIDDEMLLDMEMMDSVSPDDSVRMYLKEIGQVCLLPACAVTLPGSSPYAARRYSWRRPPRRSRRSTRR